MSASRIRRLLWCALLAVPVKSNADSAVRCKALRAVTVGGLQVTEAVLDPNAAAAPYNNSEGDIVEINQVPIFKGAREAGHELTLREANGGVYGEVVASWLDWQLRRDARAATIFRGADCKLCSADERTVEMRRID